MKEKLIRRLLGEIKNTWGTHAPWVDENGTFVFEPNDSYSGLLNAVWAVDEGYVFVFPRSLYKDYRNKVSSEEYRAKASLPKLDLPYHTCLFIEYEDDTASDMYGFPTAAVVAYYDNHPEELTYVKSANVAFDKKPFGETDEVFQLCSTRFYSDPDFYGVVSATLVTAWLNSKHSERVEHVIPAKVAKKRERTGKNTNLYAGRFTELRERNPTYSLAVDRATGVVQAHLVRGHFKKRKTGVFWWKPHIAGSGELVKREAYFIKP